MSTWLSGAVPQRPAVTAVKMYEHLGAHTLVHNFFHEIHTPPPNCVYLWHSEHPCNCIQIHIFFVNYVIDAIVLNLVATTSSFAKAIHLSWWEGIKSRKCNFTLNHYYHSFFVFGMCQHIMTVFYPSSWGAVCGECVFHLARGRATYMQWMRGTWCRGLVVKL